MKLPSWFGGAPVLQGVLVGSVLCSLVVLVYGAVTFVATGHAWEQVRAGKFTAATFFFERGNHFFEGDAYDIETALTNYERALTYENVDQKPIHYQIGRIHFIKGDLMRAVALFNEQLEIDPTYMRTYYMRGLTYGFLGAYDKAEEDFKKFLEWRPQSWAGHNDLVWVYFLAGKLDEAERYARQGLAYAPTNAWLANALGAILINQGKTEEAKQYLAQADEIFTLMTPEEWGSSYPGNDPRMYEAGLTASRQSVSENLQLVRDDGAGE